MFIYGIYLDEERAANALRGLVDAGFPIDAISGLMHQERKPEEPLTENATAASRGEVVGTALEALGGTDLAPTGSFLATGTLLAALRGGTGFGAISGLGFSRDEIEQMNRHLSQGGVIIAVETIDEWQEKAERTLRAAAAEAVSKSLSVETAVGEN